MENLKREQKERKEQQTKEREERIKVEFGKMLEVELKRKRKETYARWKKGVMSCVTHKNDSNLFNS